MGKPMSDHGRTDSGFHLFQMMDFIVFYIDDVKSDAIPLYIACHHY